MNHDRLNCIVKDCQIWVLNVKTKSLMYNLQMKKFCSGMHWSLVNMVTCKFVINGLLSPKYGLSSDFGWLIASKNWGWNFSEFVISFMNQDIQVSLREEIKSACDYRPFEKCDYNSRTANEICCKKLEYVVSQLDGMKQTIDEYHGALWRCGKEHKRK